MSNRHYSKAPIIEAVIDIQVTMPSAFVFADLSDLADILKDKFPIRNKIESFQLQLDADIGDGKSAKTSSMHEEIGIRLGDNANTRVLQLKKIGFTYSHLHPYTDWDRFSNEAKKYWELFIQHYKPEKVTRCAVRYINRIDIPKAPIEIKEYLNIYPQTPNSISQTITGMHMQLQMPQDDIGSMAIINEAIIEPVITNGISVVVDIDVFKNLAIVPINAWDTLEQLRNRKNALFEEFITDKTRELIQ